MGAKSNNNNNNIVEPLKKKPNIDDLRVLVVHDRYRLHLTRDFRGLIPVEIGDQIIVVKDAKSHCPHCQKLLKLPGHRLFVVNKENYALIIESSDNPVRGTQMNLA